MAHMSERERALLDALARAIGDLEGLKRRALEYAGGGWQGTIGGLNDLAERAGVASARARAILAEWPMSEAPAEALPDLATLARNAGAA